MKRWITIIIFFPLPLHAGIKDTVHNLSASGPGPVKAIDERRICIFCHTPHRGQPGTPLWSKDISYQEGIAYKMPSRKTLHVRPGQPTGATKLCLSCHDGTISVGALASGRKIKMTDEGKGILTAEGKIAPGSRGYIGTDLSGSHPVSVKVDESVIMLRSKDGLSSLRSLTEMKTDPDGVTLDKNNEIQCTTCHDPHEDKYYNTSGVHFWRKPTWSGVCLVCHNI